MCHFDRKTGGASTIPVNACSGSDDGSDREMAAITPRPFGARLSPACRPPPMIGLDAPAQALIEILCGCIRGAHTTKRAAAPEASRQKRVDFRTSMFLS
jgi:hypothetical protein